ncbi:OmpH family outer membrane protein [Marinicella sp. S1101]|uniref:OmpH family outer membrane protein n=1 Tax=Marinicella marina TaxID=2996016 RepID=UPI002260B94F|nr:OmpH family outer membrane protein [Marinicella marina]MCX7554813.1 OmpH family outer membrane protein [Marinicella marina]MDJ1140954.1 OmpH family outer membrane protein [Marinicella marina]
MRKLWLQVIVIKLSLLSLGDAVAEGKIGYVDMNTLISQSPQILAANQTLTTEFEEQNSRISEQEANLQELENTISKEGNFMTPDKLAELQERARILERQVRRAKEDMKDAITIRNSQLVDDVQQEIRAVVAAYAQENGYDAILINAILYANEKIDITEEILQQLRVNYSSDQ